jgi:hypothetical protein
LVPWALRRATGWRSNTRILDDVLDLLAAAKQSTSFKPMMRAERLFGRTGSVHRAG